MSYLFGGESRQSRYQTAQDLSESSFKPDDFEPTLGESLGVGNDDTYLDKVTQAYTTPARLLTRSVANLGIAADAIPTALGTYYGIDNPWWHKHVTQSLIHTSEALTPDPKTTHVSLQIADQFAGMFSDVLLTMGNPAAFSAMQGGKRVTEELDKGKDLSTSLQLGSVDALVSKAFMTVPVGFASKGLPIANRLQGAVSGAGIGTVIGSAGELANQQVLEDSGYPEEAQQHDWSNPQSLALNAAFVAAFGAWHPKILSSHKDALLTANEANAIQHPDGLSATNPAANNALVDGMNSAVHDLANGEPVTSSLNLTRRPEIPDELIALAGERMSRGERQPLEQQKADLEYKLKQIEEGDYAQQGQERAAEQQALLDAENAGRVSTTGRRVPARKLADQRKKSQEAATALGEEVRAEDAQPHRDSLDRLNELLAKDDEHRAAHAEISRFEQQHLLDNGFIRNPATELLQKQIDHEVSQLSDAYDQVNKNPTGKADDPLVMIKPDDIEAVAVARGGWKGFGDIEVKGAGWGIAKFIWRHGKKSKEQKELQVEKEDVLEFPNVIRDFHPSREASPDGSKGREWRVNLNGRTIVYADNLLNGRDGRHLVTIHAQDPNKPGHDHPLSEKRVDAPASSGKRLEAHTGDTQPEFLQQTGQEPSAKHSVDSNNNNTSKNESPEITAARDSLPDIPNDKLFEIENDDGTFDTGSAAELMARADEEAAFADQADTATSSAITCFLKFGDL